MATPVMLPAAAPASATPPPQALRRAEHLYSAVIADVCHKVAPDFAGLSLPHDVLVTLAQQWCRNYTRVIEDDARTAAAASDASASVDDTRSADGSGAAATSASMPAAARPPTRSHGRKRRATATSARAASTAPHPTAPPAPTGVAYMETLVPSPATYDARTVGATPQQPLTRLHDAHTLSDDDGITRGRRRRGMAHTTRGEHAMNWAASRRQRVGVRASGEHFTIGHTPSASTSATLSATGATVARQPVVMYGRPLPYMPPPIAMREDNAELQATVAAVLQQAEAAGGLVDVRAHAGTTASRGRGHAASTRTTARGRGNRGRGRGRGRSGSTHGARRDSLTRGRAGGASGALATPRSEAFDTDESTSSSEGAAAGSDDNGRGGMGQRRRRRGGGGPSKRRPADEATRVPVGRDAPLVARIASAAAVCAVCGRGCGCGEGACADADVGDATTWLGGVTLDASAVGHIVSGAMVSNSCGAGDSGVAHRGAADPGSCAAEDIADDAGVHGRCDRTSGDGGAAAMSRRGGRDAPPTVAAPEAMPAASRRISSTVVGEGIADDAGSTTDSSSGDEGWNEAHMVPEVPVTVSDGSVAAGGPTPAVVPPSQGSQGVTAALVRDASVGTVSSRSAGARRGSAAAGGARAGKAGTSGNGSGSGSGSDIGIESDDEDLRRMFLFPDDDGTMASREPAGVRGDGSGDDVCYVVSTQVRRTARGARHWNFGGTGGVVRVGRAGRELLFASLRADVVFA